MKHSTKTMLKKVKNKQGMAKRRVVRLERLSMAIENDFYNNLEHTSTYDDVQEFNLFNN